MEKELKELKELAALAYMNWLKSEDVVGSMIKLRKELVRQGVDVSAVYEEYCMKEKN
ncbi:hypothetical protein [Priestia filamentosa]|uniref:hypothetical protein n=1 Tax=Priestia filamentosa TaxID=1402861 RepID=UPI000A5644F9|nr:hypothetical protein [Priestia filamentosa]